VTAVASLTRVRVVVDHTMPIPLQRPTKLISRTDSLISVFSPIKTWSSVKNIFKCFFYVTCFTHIHLMRCLSSIVNLIAVCCASHIPASHITHRLAVKPRTLLRTLPPRTSQFTPALCCNDSSTDVRFTSLLAKFKLAIFNKNTNYFYAVRISISLAILSEIFIQIG